MLITGLDIATSCGAADGVPGSRPRFWTWNLRKAGEGRPARLALLMAYVMRYLDENRPDGVFYEAGMTMRVALSVGATDETLAFLRGSIGVVEACCARAKVPTIQAVDVQAARKHFTGRASFPKGKSKGMVYSHCRALGWTPANQDESDAGAIFSYGCAQMDPRAAHLTAPLFGVR